MTKYSVFFLFLLFITSCKKTEPIPPVVPPETTASFENYEDRGEVENPQLMEASGIIYSNNNPGYLWTFNNGNFPNIIYFMDSNGKGITNFAVTGAINKDWEAIGSFKETDGSTTVFLADIGDNMAQYPNYSIYWFKEPKVEIDPKYPDRATGPASKITFTLSDGAMRDMECILIDQKTKDLFIISKREDQKKLYKISGDKFINGNVVVAEYIKDINFSNPFSSYTEVKTFFFITDGNVSPDNTEILVRNYGEIYYWKRKAGESIPDALDRQAKIVPSRSKYTSTDGKGEPQGEGVCFSYNADGYYTISERVDKSIPPHLYFFKRKTP